jgi:hypothetical protein
LSKQAAFRASEGADPHVLRVCRTPDQDRHAPFCRLEISFSQGDEWKALISKYIEAIPFSGDAACVAEQRISGVPPMPVNSAMIAKVGVAARHSQSAAPRAAVALWPSQIAPPVALTEQVSVTPSDLL